MSKTLVKTGLQPTRAHDHIYDPVYTVSNQAVHLQEHQRGRLSHVERVPDYPNMFSDIPLYPRHAYRMKESAVQVGAFPPQGQVRPVADSTVLGSLRFKYFKRPVVPFLHSIPAEILLAPGTQEGEAAAGGGVQEEEPTQATRSVGIQTMYREGEAQTDPFTPDYITNPGQDDPEILNLAHLSFGKGLPASLDEVNMVHRMREKKEFEASLPRVTDEASFEQRKKLLEARELREWALREEEMKKEQEDKLQILIDTLKEREEKSEALADARVEAVRQQKMRERDEMFEVTNQRRIKTMRGLEKNRPFQEPKSYKRDIIQEHSDYASKVYAPIARMGRLPVKNQVVDYGIPLISNYQGLTALESTLPRKAFDVPVRQPAKIVPKSAQGRRGQQIVQDLVYVDKLLQDRKLEKKTEKIENVYKKFEPVLRAATPSVTAPADEEQINSVLLLQRLVRGRAIQNSMYEGKQKALQLIRELRIAEDPVETDEPPLASQLLDTTFDTMQGEVISKALDFIAKNIVRVAEERKVAAMVRLATHTRRQREAEESGRRQAEDALRKKRESHFSATMAVHASSTSRALDELFTAAVEAVSGRVARREAGLKHQVLDRAVDDLEDGADDAEKVVQDLVSSFVLPEVDRRTAQRADVMEGRRYLNAAHDTVQSVVEAMSARTEATAEATAEVAAEATAEVAAEAAAEETADPEEGAAES